MSAGRTPTVASHGRQRVGLALLTVLLATWSVGAEPRPATRGRAVVSPRHTPERVPPALGHTVQPGDSLWTIARRYGVSLEALARANRIEARGRLRVGQHLTIPGTVAASDSQEPPSPAPIVLGPPPAAGDVGFGWPIAAPVGSPFGPRPRGWHGGIDIGAARGTPIRAAPPGWSS